MRKQVAILCTQRWVGGGKLDFIYTEMGRRWPVGFYLHRDGWAEEFGFYLHRDNFLWVVERILLKNFLPLRGLGSLRSIFRGRSDQKWQLYNRKSGFALPQKIYYASNNVR